MMHDFAMTAEHVIFMDLPIVFNLDIAINGGGDMPYRWDDDYGALPGSCGATTLRAGALVRDRSLLRVSRRQRARREFGVLQACRYPELWRNDGGFAQDAVLWGGGSTWRTELCANVNLTTGRWNSLASMTASPDLPHAMPSRSATPDWCATTWRPVRRSSTPSAPGLRGRFW